MEPTTLAIGGGAWLWDKFGKTLAESAVSSVRERWEKLTWGAAADAYRTKVKKLYGTMQIMGMSEPVPLDDIFTDAYMLDKPTAFGRFDIERLKQLSADPNEPIGVKRINGLKLVVEKGNLFILGKPGAGKTTFLKYMALKAAEQTINKVPVFISLKHWADSGLELMPFMADRFDICGFPDSRRFIEELLKSGNTLVLFDGLDEVNQESGQRDRQTRAINDFVEKYDRAQCLITCRIAASDYSFKPFTYVEIADFTEKQIEVFVRNWFRDTEGNKDAETSKRFLNEFAKDDNRGLRDLARTPLLLTLLCLAFDETLTFPQRRVEIYQEALDALLKKWDSSRRIRRDEIYRKLSLGHKENMLARIGAETFEANQYFIKQREMEKHITNYVRNVPPHDTNEATDGEVILKAIEAQHGIFVERAREIYSFSHLTFQEYFAAKYIVDNAARGTLGSLITAHCRDNRWREVFLLTTSLLSDAGQFVDAFKSFIDDLVRGVPILERLLGWASHKSIGIDAEADRVRQTYVCIGVYYEERTVKLDLAFEQTLPFLFETDPNIDLDYNLAQARFQSKHDSTVEHYLESARSLMREMGLIEFLNQFNALPFPSKQTPTLGRERFQIELRSLMIKHRDIGHDWNLSGNEESRLADYINSSVLLRDCLELATMAPDKKQALLSSLYLPPPTGRNRKRNRRVPVTSN